ncbi:MAG: PilZ domain-containing protein [Planctomycetes bacterium]|nr:PilZ domain-containing protein [Planctomycetota bacterium]
MVSQNRRRMPRALTNHLAHVVQENIETGERTETLGKTADVSESGIRFHGRKMFDPYQHVEICLALGDSLIEARGAVRHLTINKRGTVALGIEFIDMPDNDKRFIRNYCFGRAIPV